MTEFLALAIAAFAVDGLVWGFAGFFVFRLLGGGKRWWIGILATVLLSLAEVSDLLGTDRLANLVTFDPFSDVLITVFAIAVGFLLAGFLDERRARRAGVAPSGDAR